MALGGEGQGPDTREVGDTLAGQDAPVEAAGPEVLGQPERQDHDPDGQVSQEPARPAAGQGALDRDQEHQEAQGCLSGRLLPHREGGAAGGHQLKQGEIIV